MKPTDKYMTDEEISCIQNIVSWKPTMDKEKKMQIEMLEKQYKTNEEKGQIGCFISTYEMVMGCVASERGNMGEYDKSDEISQKIITENLYLRRLYGTNRGLYNIIWNYEQRQKKGIPNPKQRDLDSELRYCVILSDFCLETVYANFYGEKLSAKKQNRNR